MHLVAINGDNSVDLYDSGHTFHLSPSDFQPARDVQGNISMAAVLTGNVTSADGVVMQTAFPLTTLDGQRIALHVATQFGSFGSGLLARLAIAAYLVANNIPPLLDAASAP